MTHYHDLRENGKYRPRGCDPTPEQIAERRKQFVARTHGDRGAKMTELGESYAFYAWLNDPEDLRPLAQVDKG
jgi:hypothetical protein